MVLLFEGPLLQFLTLCSPNVDDNSNFSSSVYHKTIHDTLQQIDLVRRLIAAFPSQLHPSHSARDVWQVFHSYHHGVASLMGAEGLHQIGNSASVMRLYHQLGVRYITLTHDCNNRYADAALAPKPIHNGLSSAGKEIVREMNRLGMIVDLSHTSASTMRDAYNVTKAPAVFSHSSALALCPHPRNVPDDVLWMVKKNRGVVMVTFYPQYTNCKNSRMATLQEVADHVMYIGELIGFGHVGIGSDFDGMDHGPTELEDVSKYPALITELARRGVSSHDLGGVIGGNVLRVLTEVEEVAETMNDVLPLEDDVERFF
jgi:membrane dipeptidase